MEYSRFLTITLAALMGCYILSAAYVFAPECGVAVYPSEQMVVDGAVRTFRVIVPPRMTGQRLPVVFHFHGHGNTPESEADRTRLDQLAAAQRFVLVYPAAINGSWSVHAIDPGSAERNPDIAFFDALLARLATWLNVDRQRVYVSGMSLGAAFVHELAMARSREIAAAVVHSGLALSRIDGERPPPIMMVVGANEISMVSAARQAAQSCREQGHVCELLIVQGIGHQWAGRRNLQMWRFLEKHRLNQ